MPSQVLTTVENKFTKGLVTEFTGLNFPEDAAIESDNTEYTIVGDTVRRLGCDYEANYTLNAINRASAVNTYKWNNVAGQGEVQFLVSQIGATLYFWDVTSSTTVSPISANKLASTVTISDFIPSGGTFDSTLECQFTDGNGYLFVLHPSIDPIYCEYSSGIITGNRITVKIRDFTGVLDGLAVTTRPSTLSGTHQYNLSNQGWAAGAAYQATQTDATLIVFTAPQAININVAAGIAGITPGDAVSLSFNLYPLGPFGPPLPTSGAGNITAYAGTVLTVNVTSGSSGVLGANTIVVTPTNIGYLTTWNTQVGGYPSNSDVWWRFKNTSNVFNPGTTLANVTLNAGDAPKGRYLLSAFNQLRSGVSGVPSLNDITTLKRPRTGAWFQGRVWYTGVDAYQAATATTSSYAWTESIYFSQIINNPSQFGNCYQVNDPTSETLFDLLPTDGGVIYIQGSGSIYKLFPIQNGMLIFAANGVWQLTGSQGIGFSANDYTLLKLSNIQSISSTSFINVQGLPYFWNEEGIYTVQPTKNGGLSIETITVGTILSFYNSIPLEAKKYVRGAYHPIDYVIQWIYKSTNSTSVTDRYAFDKILNYNTYNKAFYPYTIDITSASINGINYVSGPGGSTTVLPTFKYISSDSTKTHITYSELRSTSYVDWASTGTSVDYESSFTTGYKLHGQAQRRFQIPYIYVYSRTNGASIAYKIQGLWDYATTGNTGRWSTAQVYHIFSPNYSVVNRRTTIRGQGLVLQLKFKSVSGLPFDFIGWSSFETQNTGV